MAHDRINVSRKGVAHIPGMCWHLTPEKIQPPRWGWLKQDMKTWDLIGTRNSIRTTGGTAGRLAAKRCEHCEHNINKIRSN